MQQPQHIDNQLQEQLSISLPAGYGSVIVCVCNALRESDVRAKARDGGTACQVYARLGCKPQCGQCLPFARRLIREENGRQAA